MPAFREGHHLLITFSDRISICQPMTETSLFWCKCLNIRVLRCVELINNVFFVLEIRIILQLKPEVIFLKRRNDHLGPVEMRHNIIQVNLNQI